MSKGNSRYDTIALYRKVTIDSTNKAIVISDTDGADVINLDEGDYYNHLDDSLATDGLLKAIVDKINATKTTLTYTLAAATPSGSSLANSGITLSADGVFNILMADASWTLDRRLIGYAIDAGGVGSQTSYTSPYSIYAKWQTPHAPDDLRRFQFREVYESAPMNAGARANAFAGPWVRRCDMYSVPGGHVREDGADTSEVATQAGLPQGDTHNSLSEFLRQGGIDPELLLTFDGEELADFSGIYELVTIADKARLGRWLDELEDVPGKEQYSFSLEFLLRDGSPLWRDP